MDFVLRDAVESDLDQCLALLTDRFLYDDAQLGALTRMWAHIISSRCGMANVIAERDRPARLIQFGTLVFVDDERAAQYHALLRPGIGRSLLYEWHANEKPFLSRDQVASANADGNLNLVVTHHGHVEPDDSLTTERMRSATYEQALAVFRGWNLRTYINEIFTSNPLRDGKEMGAANGFRLGRYTDDQLQAAGIPSERAPWIWMATRDDVADRPVGIALSLLFNTFSAPRFRLTFCEQELLKLAMEGHTDESISRITDTSLTTTKKRFRTIYEKVEIATSPLEPLHLPHTDGACVRGAEIRRHLLKYLVEHPEELRPYEYRSTTGWSLQRQAAHK